MNAVLHTTAIAFNPVSKFSWYSSGVIQDLRSVRAEIPLHAKVPIMITIELANASCPNESGSRSLLSTSWSAKVASAAPNDEERRRIAFKMFSLGGIFSCRFEGLRLSFFARKVLELCVYYP